MFLFALAVLALAAVTSRLKVKLPGINGNMSVNLLLPAYGSREPERCRGGCGHLRFRLRRSAGPSTWPTKDAKFNPQQMAFNISMMAFASSMASLFFHAEGLRGGLNVGLGPGDSDLVPGTDGAGGRDRSGERGQGGRTRVVERCSPGVSLTT